MSDETQYVCFECIGDSYLSTEIEESGPQHDCMICEETRASIGFEDLCERVHKIVEDVYEPTANEPRYGWGMYKEAEIDWEREGLTIDEVLQEIVETDSCLVEKIRESCSGCYYSYDAAMNGEEDPYGYDVRYGHRPPDTYALHGNWMLFQKEIRTQARFFSKTAETVLDGIFGELHQFKTINRPLIRDAGPGTKTDHLYRGRRAFGDSDIAQIVESPGKELGAPPSRAAGSGRMNPRWISMFYGAFDPETCVAELRAPVGSAVVIGRFDIVRPLRLLDLEAFRQLIVHRASYFDPTYRAMRNKAHFLESLVDIMSQPVMPSDEDYEYLPTQAVAEYLSEKIEPKLDGLIFRSSQRAGKGENVVLFRRASTVEPDGTEALDSQTRFGWQGEDGEAPQVTVWTQPIIKDTTPTGDEWDVWPRPIAVPEVNQAALRVVLEGIEIRDIRAVEYKMDWRTVRRYAPPPNMLKEDF